jgi:hypothetical protein
MYYINHLKTHSQIIEVECQPIFDITLPLHSGEKLYEIVKPSKLKGYKVYSFALKASKEDAKEQAMADIYASLKASSTMLEDLQEQALQEANRMEVIALDSK